MKVAIFEGNGGTNFDKFINEWLDENPKAIVKHVLQSESMAYKEYAGEIINNTTISIWYEEEK